jgi:hypothetical protein
MMTFDLPLFFQQACGYEYTSKLQRMFQDIGVSKTLIPEYEKYCENHHVTDIGTINRKQLIPKIHLIYF